MHPAAAPVAAVSALAAAAAGVCAWGGLSAGAQLFGPVLVAPSAPDALALTFDDGPNPAVTPALLEVLARHRMRATFFLIGTWVRREPGLTREIAAAGHVVGNHTATHPWLPRLPARAIQQELADCNAALEDVLGQQVALFRPPHGARRPAVLRAARALGLQTVQWNLICGDWNPLPEGELLGRLTRGIGRHRAAAQGTCVVLHDGGQHGIAEARMPTVRAVDALLGALDPATRLVVPPAWI